MARVITIPVPGISVPRLDMPRPAPNALGEAIGRAGGQLANDLNQFDAAQKASELNDSELGMAEAYSQLKEELRTVPFTEKAKRFKEGSSAIQARFVSRNRDRWVNEQAMQTFRRMTLTHEEHVKQDVFEGRRDHEIARTSEALKTFAQDAATARGPGERQLALESGIKALGLIRDGGYITELQHNERRSQFLGDADLFTAEALIDKDPATASKVFSSDAWRRMFPNLVPRQAAALHDDSEREVKSRRAEFMARQEGVVTGEQVRINQFANGQAAYTQADLDRMKGKVSIDSFNRLQMQYDDARRGIDQRVNEVSGSLQAVQSGRPLDPKSNDDRKAVDLVWGANSATMPEDQRLDGLVQFSKRVGMVPEQGKKMIRGSLRSANDQQVMAGVELVGRLKNENPALLDDFSKEDVRIALSVLSQTEAGVKPEEALKRYRDGLTLSDAVRDVRIKEFSDEVKSNPGDAVNALRKATGGEKSWGALMAGKWISDADVPPEAVEEFHRVAREEYARTGNMDSANRFAAESLRRVYGVSELSGGRAVTRYAPEQWYGNRGLSASDNAKWIREQAVSEATTALGHAPEGALSLVPARRVGDDGRPAYIVNITKPDGTIVTPERNGKPLLFVPDFKQSPAAKQLQDKNTGKIKAAKDARQFELDTVNAPRGLGL